MQPKLLMRQPGGVSTSQHKPNRSAFSLHTFGTHADSSVFIFGVIFLLSSFWNARHSQLSIFQLEGNSGLFLIRGRSALAFDQDVDRLTHWVELILTQLGDGGAATESL